MSFPVAEGRIADAEQQLGRRLPADLRSWLMRSNGGEVSTADDDWLLFPVFDPSDRKRLSRSANHIVRETEKWRSWANFPRDAIAIAENGEGDALIVLATDEIEKWNHETGQHAPVIVSWD